MSRVVYIIAILFSVCIGKAQNISTPVITCVSVLPNGDVSITWNQVSDPSLEFTNYSLTANGTTIATINNITTTTFTHTTSGANAASITYVLNVNGTGGAGAFTLTSQPFSSIYLDVINNADGYATLTWTVPAAAITGKFYIYRSVNSSAFNLYDSTAVSQANYLDEITLLCTDTQIDYRVSYRYANGCESFSNTDGTIFKDLLPPAEVIITDIDVDPLTGFTTINWSESPETDVKEYWILKLNPASGTFQQIDVVVGKTNTTYTDLNVSLQSAAVASQSYKVIPVDECNNNQALKFVSTIFVDGTPNRCALTIDIAWNPFITGETGNNQIIQSSIIEIAVDYELWIDKGTGFNYFTTISKGTTTYTVKNVTPETLICYQIRAKLPNGEISNSSQYCYNLHLEPASLDNYIAHASVTPTEEVELKLYTGKIISNNTIEIYKSQDQGITFDSIYSQPVNQTVFTYLDTEVDVQAQSYQYYFVLKDVCKIRRDSSNIASTIFLETSYHEFDSVPQFFWNAYKRYYSNVHDYVLERSINESDYVEVDSVAGSFVNIADHIKRVLSQSFKTLCYQIKAVEDTLNQYGFREVSYSNQVCIEDTPTIYIPTGFVIDGVSGNFIPRFTYLIDKSYSFAVYNRWGQTVFQTNDPLQGWDGYFNGQPVTQGAYAFKVIFKDENNEDQILTGSVTVLE